MVYTLTNTENEMTPFQHFQAVPKNIKERAAEYCREWCPCEGQADIDRFLRDFHETAIWMDEEELRAEDEAFMNSRYGQNPTLI